MYSFYKSYNKELKLCKNVKLIVIVRNGEMVIFLILCRNWLL